MWSLIFYETHKNRNFLRTRSPECKPYREATTSHEGYVGFSRYIAQKAIDHTYNK